MRVSESLKLVPMIESKDYGSAGIDSDSVNMGLVASIALCFLFGALTGDSVLKVYCGASAGTKTTAVAFQYRLGSGDYKATNADGFGDLVDVASTGLTLTAATFDHRAVVIEVRPDMLTDGVPWVTIEINSTATVLNVACQGVADPRYSTHGQVSVI